MREGYYVVYSSMQEWWAAFLLMGAIRDAGQLAELDYRKKGSLRAQMRRAGRGSYRHAAIVQDDGRVTLRNLITGEQTILSPEALVKQL